MGLPIQQHKSETPVPSFRMLRQLKISKPLSLCLRPWHLPGTSPTTITIVAKKLHPSSQRSGQRDRNSIYTHFRAIIPNYKEEEITAFLDIVDEVRQFCVNLWALVERNYVDLTAANDVTSRDSESLKAKFDKLVSERGENGNPGCPDYIINAKNISQVIHLMCHAGFLGEDNALVGVAEDEATVIQREGKRKRGMMGISRKKKSLDEAVLEQVGGIKDSFTKIASSFSPK